MLEEGADRAPRVKASIPSGRKSLGAAPRAAFEALSRQHAPQLLSQTSKRLGRKLRQRIESGDLLQEALLDAGMLFECLDDWASMDGPQFVRWMTSIIELRVKGLARFHLKAERRRVGRESPRLPSESFLSIPGRQKTPSRILMEAERDQRIERALKTLSPRERRVIELVHFAGLKPGEAAVQMGKSAGATAVLLCTARRKLKEALEKTGGAL